MGSEEKLSQHPADAIYLLLKGLHISREEERAELGRPEPETLPGFWKAVRSPAANSQMLLRTAGKCLGISVVLALS